MLEHVVIAWFISQATMASVLGDWFFITKGSTVGDCTVYKGDAHNLFGNICDDPVASLINTSKALRSMAIANVALAVVLIFTTIIRPNMKLFKIVTAFVIFCMSLLVTILWHTTSKSNELPEDVNYFGVGWYFQLVVSVFSAASCIVTFSSPNVEI